MMHCANLTVFVLPVLSWPSPVVSSTTHMVRVGEAPSPRTTVTLRILAIAARPPVSLPTTLFLCASSLRQVDLSARRS